MLAVLLGGTIFTYAAMNMSPQASSDSIAVEIKGAILYPESMTPDDVNERISLTQVTGATEQVLMSGLKHSEKNNEKIDNTPNRSYSLSAPIGLTYGSTIRLHLYKEGASPSVGCYTEFTIPSASKLAGKDKLRLDDKQFMPADPAETTAVYELDRIKAGCATNQTPSPSPTAATTASPTPLPTISTSATPTVKPSSTPTQTTQTNLVVPFDSHVCSKTTSKVNFVFVVDNSGSMTDDEDRKNAMQATVRRVTRQLKADDKAAVISFSNPTDIKVRLTSNMDDVTNAVNNLQFGAKNSNINGGVKRASDLLLEQAPGEPAVVLVISDHLSTMTNEAKVIARADASKNVRYMTGVVGGNNNNFLDELAEAGKGSYLFLPNGADLDEKVTRIINGLNRAYSNCVTLTPTLEKSSIVDDETTTLTITVGNFSREAIKAGTVTQALPDGIVTTDNKKSVSVSVPALDSGKTYAKTFTVKGDN